MAEEEVAVAAAVEVTVTASAETSPAEETVPAAETGAAADLKRKHTELESEANTNGKESDSVEKEKEEEESIDVKRLRLDDDEEKPEGLEVSDNGVEEDKEKEFVKVNEKPSQEKNVETTEEVDNKKHSTTDLLAADTQQLVSENSELENENQKATDTKLQAPSTEGPQQVDDPRLGDLPASDAESMSRKMEVPNNKVGVLIGKGGETIRSLQYNSGAKIQIMRDADVDPQSTNRPVELIGSLENINRAEKLIKDVIAEADAGGSPALIAKGFTSAQAAAAVEEVLIQVPNEKVGVLIGKGGETIKNLQTKSGARIQLIPHEGDQPKERTVRVSGDKKQIQWVRDMIKDVLNQSPRQSSLGGGYSQQSFRPRGPSSQQQWGSRGPNSSQPRGTGYQQRDRYPSQNSQYPPQGYSNYPPHAGPQGNYGSGWEQRPPRMQGLPHQGGGGYDYYGGQGQMASNPYPAHGPGPNPSNMGPPPQGNYNYPQPYGQPGNYPGQGYAENKYENQAQGQHTYGGSHPQGSYPGFAPPDQYAKAPPSNAPPAQNYGQPRPSYQGGPTQQPYGQNAVPPQQTYPQVVYNQPQPGAGSAQVYPQQQGPGYAQVGGYSSYPAPQQGYGDQSAQNTGYGSYQGGADPAAYDGPGYGAPPTGQSGFAQPVSAQPGYDQSATNPSGYGAVPGGGGPAGHVPAGVSTQPGYAQPGYDANQMYGAAPR